MLFRSQISAVLFQFLPGKGGDSVSVDSCTGWVRHAGRFRESRTYVFTLSPQLSAGAVEVLLLDSGKQPLLHLNRHTPTGVVALDGKGRYFLHWTFQSATGKCALRW